MIFTSRLDEAVKLAARLHRNQTRNDDEQTPYVSHLMAVAALLSEFTSDEDIIIAGLMHDSLEDVKGYTYEQLIVDCGQRVADIVMHVSEPLDANKEMIDQLPWLVRKEAYLETLRKGGMESAMVSSADKIHNTESFIKDLNNENGVFASKFGSSVRNRLWFHEQVLTLVTRKLGEDHALIKKFVASTEAFRKVAALSQ